MKIQPVTTKFVNYNTQNIDKKYNDFENSATSDILFTHAVKTGTRFNILEFFKRIFCIKPKMVEMPKPKPEPILTEVQKVAKRIKENYGIECDFAECMNVALCTEAVARIMKMLYGEQSLPQKVLYEQVPDYVYGLFDATDMAVFINSDLHNIFSTREAMEFEMLKAKGKHFYNPDEKSTTHYLRTFIHEFSHCAHAVQIAKKEGLLTWLVLHKKTLPTSVARFITRFKLGKYAADTNLCEFMAERMTKDITDRLNYFSSYIGSPEDVDYSNIFQRKWNCRYISPQAFLDYYTQQIWNGDMAGVQEAEDKITVYLTEIERKESKLKQKSVKGVVDVVAAKLWSLGGILTNGISNIADYFNSIGAKITKDSNGIKIHDNKTKLKV